MKLIRILPVLLAVIALAAGGERVVDWEQLSDRDGLICEVDSDKAFTGTGIWHWPNGNKKVEAEFVDGKLNGIAFAWYENGQMEVETRYRDHELHGKKTGWHENGQKSFECEYRDGKEHGRMVLWRENGSKKEAIDYIEGREHGQRTRWYENGQKEMEGELRDDKAHGSCVEWYESGVKKLEDDWREGLRQGRSTGWYENGNKAAEGDFLDGKEHGKWTLWYENGRKMEEAAYLDGKPHGKVVGWYENGKKKAEIDYREGIKISEKIWDEEGNEIVYPPEPEGFTQMLGEMLSVDWDNLMDSLFDPEMERELADVKLTDEGVQYIYGEFLRTIVRQSKPGDYQVSLAEKGRETLSEVHNLLRIVHNLNLAISGENAEPWKLCRYGGVLAAIEATLLVDRLTIPLALAGDDSVDVEWFEYHQHYLEEAVREYSVLFSEPGVLVESYTHPATGLAFPEKLATLERGRVKDYESPGLGTSVGYNSSGVKVTIYLYNRGLNTIPDELNSDALKDEFQECIRAIRYQEEIGSYSDLEILAEGEAIWGKPGSEVRALHADFSFTDSGLELLSHLYLRPFKDHFLKVRFTCERSGREKAEKELEEFLAALGDRAPDS